MTNLEKEFSEAWKEQTADIDKSLTYWIYPTKLTILKYYLPTYIITTLLSIPTFYGAPAIGAIVLSLIIWAINTVLIWMSSYEIRSQTLSYYESLPELRYKCGWWEIFETTGPNTFFEQSGYDPVDVLHQMRVQMNKHNKKELKAQLTKTQQLNALRAMSTTKKQEELKRLNNEIKQLEDQKTRTLKQVEKELAAIGIKEL